MPHRRLAQMQTARELKWVPSDTGEEYIPDAFQTYFRGLFSPTPHVRMCGRYTERDYVEAELLERVAPSAPWQLCPKAFDGCLIRLVPRWENKQFNGEVASFTRLKLLCGDRAHQYRLRVSWYEPVPGDETQYRIVTSLEHPQVFRIGAHHSKRPTGGTRTTRSRANSLDLLSASADESSIGKTDSCGDVNQTPPAELFNRFKLTQAVLKDPAVKRERKRRSSEVAHVAYARPVLPQDTLPLESGFLPTEQTIPLITAGDLLLADQSSAVIPPTRFVSLAANSIPVISGPVIVPVSPPVPMPHSIPPHHSVHNTFHSMFQPIYLSQTVGTTPQPPTPLSMDSSFIDELFGATGLPTSPPSY